MIFQRLQNDIWPSWCHQRSFEAGSGTWTLQKPKKIISILTKTHMNHDQIHHTRNNWLGAIFFSTGDSHTKGRPFLVHLGLEDITEVDTDPKGRLVSFNPLMHNVPKWSDTLKILQQMLQDLYSVSDHFGKLCIKVSRLLLLMRVLFVPLQGIAPEKSWLGALFERTTKLYAK